MDADTGMVIGIVAWVVMATGDRGGEMTVYDERQEW